MSSTTRNGSVIERYAWRPHTEGIDILQTSTEVDLLMAFPKSGKQDSYSEDSLVRTC